MTPETPSQLSNIPAGQLLQRAVAEKARANRTRLAAELGIFAILALLIPALLDYCYFWPVTTRCLAELAWIVLVAVVLGSAARQWRRLHSAKAAALELERRHPAIRCDVSTAAEYAERPGEHPLQADLVSGLQQRADFHLRIVGTPWRRHSLVWFGVATLAMGWILFLVLVPISRLALQRILLPWTVPYYTRIAVLPGAAEIPATSDFDVAAKFRGRLPAQSRIEWKTGQGLWTNSPLAVTGRDSAHYLFKNVRDGFIYRIAANDAISPEYRVTVYPTPDVATWQLDVVPPAYAQLPPQRIANGDVAALRGSELHWSLTSTRPLSSARLQFEKGAPDIGLLPADGAWTGGMTLKTDAAYRARLVDTAKHANLHPPLNRLVAIPDAPPRVEISSPDEVVMADPGDKISITVEAADDIGLSSVNLIYQRPGRPLTTVSLLPSGPTERRLTATPVLDLAPLQLKPFDVVIYYAEARDNNTYDGPGVGRSRAQFIIIRGPPGSKAPPSSGGGGGQEINLTELERDLIGATTRLADTAPRAAMQDLATAQEQVRQDTMKGASAIRASLAGSAASTVVNGALTAGIDAMAQAEARLNSGDRSAALDQEGLALAALLQAGQFAPSSNSDSKSAGLKIVLDDISARAAQHQETQKQLSQALAQARGLAEAQKALQSKGSGQKPGQGAGSDEKKDADQGQDQANAPGKDGKGTGGNSPSTQGSGNSPTELTSQQEALAQQARQLAEMLHKAAGKDSAVGHGLGQSAEKAAGEMDVAAQEMKRGKGYNLVKVSIAQRNSIEALGDVVDVLKNTMAADDHGTGGEDESIPPEYADQLALYFQKLSHEK